MHFLWKWVYNWGAERWLCSISVWSVSQRKLMQRSPCDWIWSAGWQLRHHIRWQEGQSLFSLPIPSHHGAANQTLIPTGLECVEMSEGEKEWGMGERGGMRGDKLHWRSDHLVSTITSSSLSPVHCTTYLSLSPPFYPFTSWSGSPGDISESLSLSLFLIFYLVPPFLVSQSVYFCLCLSDGSGVMMRMSQNRDSCRWTWRQPWPEKHNSTVGISSFYENATPTILVGPIP